MFSRISERRKIKIPSEKEIERMEGFEVKGTFEDAQRVISQSYKHVYSDENIHIFQKGALSRYGIIVIHLSILLILFGALVGLIFGLKGYMVLGKDEQTQEIRVRGKDRRQIELPFLVRCRDFKIYFYPTGEVKDYVSLLEIIENGRVVLKRDVLVNNPLRYKGYYIYQASYENRPVFTFSIDGRKVYLKEGELYREGDTVFIVMRYEKKIHNFGEGILIGYIEAGEPKTVWLLRNVENKKKISLSGKILKIEDIGENFFTGLEVTRDPGIPIVWTGFIFLLLGLFINLSLHDRRIFLIRKQTGAFVSGFSFGHKDRLLKEIEDLKERLHVTP